MELEVFEFRDPGQVVLEATADHPLREGDVLLALVREPSVTQELVGVRRLPRRSRGLDQFDRSRLIASTAERMCPARTPGQSPKHSFMTIVARRGFAVFGPNEGEWLTAWHFSNHFTDAFSGSLVVVTEHGWVDFMSDLGGYEPRLADSGL